MTAPLNLVSADGQGVVPADLLNTFLQGSLNVAALRAFTGVTGMTVWTAGTVSAGDGGQGIFGWSPDNLALDDNGLTTIVPYGSTGSGPSGSTPAWTRIPLNAATGSIPLSALVNIGALSILGNNTMAGAPIMALTVAQIVAMLVGTTANTLAAGNDPRFSLLPQIVRSGNYTLAATDVGVEQYFSPGTPTLTLPAAGVFTAGSVSLIPVRVATGCTLTVNPAAGATLIWIPSGLTGPRTVLGPGRVIFDYFAANSWSVGAGGLS